EFVSGFRVGGSEGDFIRAVTAGGDEAQGFGGLLAGIRRHADGAFIFWRPGERAVVPLVRWLSAVGEIPGFFLWCADQGENRNRGGGKRARDERCQNWRSAEDEGGGSGGKGHAAFQHSAATSPAAGAEP